MQCGRMLGGKLDEKHHGMRQYGASFALKILTTINLLNYADRYVPAAVKSLIEADLHINDFESSLPSTAMVLIYMLFAVIFGSLADKQIFDRRILLCAGIGIWSCATALAGLSKNLTQLVAIRSLVGVGEAAYGTIAPPMISDFYPEKERNTAYSIFYLAVPVGSAIGFGVGSLFGSAFGWRVAFFVCGVPGALAALCVLRLADPVRGINDSSSGPNPTKDSPTHTSSLSSCGEVHSSEQLIDKDPTASTASDEEDSPIADRTISWKEHLTENWIETKEILQNKHFMVAVLGTCANYFSLGGLAEWFPTFLVRYTALSIDSAGLLVGAATVIGGIGGTLLGSKVAEHYRGRMKSSYFFFPGCFTIAAAGLMLITINITQYLWLEVVLIFLTQLLAWTATGPMAALCISVIRPELRARSMGFLIFVQHILGDVISPPIIGALSDHFHSLRLALQCTWIAAALSGLVWLGGWMFLSPLEEKQDWQRRSEGECTEGGVRGWKEEKGEEGAQATEVVDVEQRLRTQGQGQGQGQGHLDQWEAPPSVCADEARPIVPLMGGPDGKGIMGMGDGGRPSDEAADSEAGAGVSFVGLLCGRDPLTLDEGGLVVPSKGIR